ncbi:hypothetical protein [Burkholderia sp. ABCPW 11]|uniref:hypothetical protein n=1 Tax=Burkholderia sp. ABCPW 11 TaxID=1637859 RepID=UPI0012FD21F4
MSTTEVPMSNGRYGLRRSSNFSGLPPLCVRWDGRDSRRTDDTQHRNEFPPPTRYRHWWNSFKMATPNLIRSPLRDSIAGLCGAGHDLRMILRKLRLFYALVLIAWLTRPVVAVSTA